jgi:hypothetical protein
VTAAIIILAAGAHVLAGGSLPEPGITVGLLVLTLAPVMILTKIRISAPVMAVLLGAGQVVLHGAFSALSVSAGFSPMFAEHIHGVGPTLPATSALMMSRHTADPGLPMLLLHAAATLVTALVLARGEAALWALAAWLRPLIRFLTRMVIHPLVSLPVWPDVVIPSRWRSLRLPALRGPPLRSSAR